VVDGKVFDGDSRADAKASNFDSFTFAPEADTRGTYAVTAYAQFWDGYEVKYPPWTKGGLNTNTGNLPSMDKAPMGWKDDGVHREWFVSWDYCCGKQSMTIYSSNMTKGIQP